MLNMTVGLCFQTHIFGGVFK